MKALFVLAVLVLILLLLGQVRVGGRAEFSAEGFFLWIRLGRFKLKILPAGPKEEKIGKPKKPTGWSWSSPPAAATRRTRPCSTVRPTPPWGRCGTL